MNFIGLSPTQQLYLFKYLNSLSYVGAAQKKRKIILNSIKGIKDYDLHWCDMCYKDGIFEKGSSTIDILTGENWQFTINIVCTTCKKIK